MLKAGLTNQHSTAQVGKLPGIRGWTPILMLHEVLPDTTNPLPRYAVTQSYLRALLNDFAGRGYTSGTLDDVLNPGGRPHAGDSTTGRSGGKRRLVLTFDDGTCDFLEYALPVLEETGFRATLFVVAGFPGGRRTWSPFEDEGGQVPLITAEDVRNLHATGYTIGSHTMHHKALTALDTADARAEVTRSREILSNLVGEPVRWFAYPYLAADEKARLLVREAGYTGACGGYNAPHERYYLNRLEASLYTIPQLRIRTNGLFHSVRQTLRQMRSRVRPQA
jgi:peptidoglycan/xylan/chitin deacetylase (PgdA/CDA1 family)